ncbi:helix-turn-helix domain-containing protein [Vibrio sp. RE88]|uniref:helix-turn-helix domain-containing protein n=1 Tax=Vibrio sp. RE88 TaxID=2607610 RepID=UPI0014933C2E|nr:helix-turn-helix domain-containing protein [Vibrio sp. RE88]NOH60917.1 helix-turn-helix transcriptional regulator [Vibrio sp. RE88]
MKNNSEQLDILRDNIQFGLNKSKETKASLSRKTGVTRSTIYKILDGKVERVQTSTVERIANFFGTTCHIIQNESLEDLLSETPVVSVCGNKNPIAVPILSEIEFVQKSEYYIGDLITDYPLTYHFSEGSNIVAIRVGQILSSYFTRGNLLIIDRSNHNEKELSKLIVRDGALHSLPPNTSLLEGDFLFGVILEERFCV